MKHPRSISIVPLAMVVALLALAGCDSDSTAPKDEVPPISEQAAVEQAGYLAYYVLQSYDVYQDYLTSKDVYTHTFTTGDVHGSFTLDFRNGGSTGAPCASDDESCDYVHIYTDTSDGQSVDLYETYPTSDPPLISTTFDIEVYPYDNTLHAENGTINGSGQMQSGVYTSTFTIEEVQLGVGTYPPAGSLTYTSGEHEVAVEFDGTRYATLTIGDTTREVDLDTGELVPLP
jgi:hypothetical protein